MFWERFSAICLTKGEKPNAVANAIGISSATITKWKNGAIPNSDFVVKIAEYFNVPTDYLLGNGIFKHWDDLLKKKNEVLKVISIASSRISNDILNGVDNIAFAKLVFAYDVVVQNYSDGFGIEIKDPIPTYPTSLSRISKGPSLDDSEWLSLIHQLPPDAQIEFRGEIKGYLKRLNEESVAADEELKKTGTENMGK